MATRYRNLPGRRRLESRWKLKRRDISSDPGIARTAILTDLPALCIQKQKLLRLEAFDMHAEPRITVVICTHSPRRKYSSTVHLKRWPSNQSVLLPFDLIIIDNASAQPVSSWCDLGWTSAARVIVEPKLGLTNARIRAIAESHTELLVWVDDDNLLEPDYLAQASAIAREWPMLGVWGCGQFPHPNGKSLRRQNLSRTSPTSPSVGRKPIAGATRHTTLKLCRNGSRHLYATKSR